jgi:hypothetical protein
MMFTDRGNKIFTTCDGRQRTQLCREAAGDRFDQTLIYAAWLLTNEATAAIVR